MGKREHSEVCLARGFRCTRRTWEDESTQDTSVSLILAVQSVWLKLQQQSPGHVRSQVFTYCRRGWLQVCDTRYRGLSQSAAKIHTLRQANLVGFRFLSSSLFPLAHRHECGKRALDCSRNWLSPGKAELIVRRGSLKGYTATESLFGLWWPLFSHAANSRQNADRQSE